MTRYARTKDGVYQILRESKISDTCIRYDAKPNKKLECHIFSENIIKESDNLEDLIDEFVGIDDWNRHHKIENPNNIEIVKNFLKTFKEKYGVIWTDKGLIYVAKLNKDGEWELI